MGIPINGIPWIPIEVTLLFLAGEGPLHSVPLGGYGCVSSHSSHLFLDSETLKTWLKTCTRQVVYPIDLQRVIIFQQSRISVYEKTCTTSFSMGFFSWFKVTKTQDLTKKTSPKDLDISSFSKPSCCACRRSSQSSSQMSLGSVSLRSGQILVGHSNSEPWVGLSEILLFSVKTRWIFLKSWSFFWSVFVVVGGVKVLFCFIRF